MILIKLNTNNINFNNYINKLGVINYWRGVFLYKRKKKDDNFKIKNEIIKEKFGKIILGI